MNALKEKMKKVVKQAVNTAIREEMEEWPPKCDTLIYYQPKRPVRPIAEKK